MGYLRSRFESRAHPSNPDEDIIELFAGGTASYTGKKVNETQAMSATAVWAAVRLLSETIASLPLHLYRRLDRGKEICYRQPLFDNSLSLPRPAIGDG